MTAFRPGASPPPVLIAMRRMGVSIETLLLDRRLRQARREDGMWRHHEGVAGLQDALNALEELGRDGDARAQVGQHAVALVGVEPGGDSPPLTVLFSDVAEDAAPEAVVRVIDRQARVAERLSVPEHPRLLVGAADHDAHRTRGHALRMPRVSRRED